MIQVILPVLDEQLALPWVLERFPLEFEPLVVDNGSTDDSVEVARSLGARVVTEPARGFGAACHTGLMHATSLLVCFMDCDGSLDPRALPDIARRVHEGSADLVLGARVPDRGAWPLHARVGNRYLAKQVRRRTGVRLTDLGPMRAARREALIDLGIKDRRFGYPLEMVLRAATNGWRIHELPVRYRTRTGRSKVTGSVKGTIRAVRDMAGALS